MIPIWITVVCVFVSLWLGIIMFVRMYYKNSISAGHFFWLAAALTEVICALWLFK